MEQILDLTWPQFHAYWSHESDPGQKVEMSVSAGKQFGTAKRERRERAIAGALRIYR